MGEHPEHEKLRLVSERSQAIGAFLDTCGFTLCRWEPSPALPIDHIDWKPAGFYPVRGTIQQILARYFDIDLDKLDAEKQAMLEAMP